MSGKSSAKFPGNVREISNLRANVPGHVPAYNRESWPGKMPPRLGDVRHHACVGNWMFLSNKLLGLDCVEYEWFWKVVKHHSLRRLQDGSISDMIKSGRL